jgi:hypothetical protein
MRVVSYLDLAPWQSLTAALITLDARAPDPAGEHGRTAVARGAFGTAIERRLGKLESALRREPRVRRYPASSSGLIRVTTRTVALRRLNSLRPATAFTFEVDRK